MLRIVRTPDIAGPKKVLMAGTPPGSSLVSKLEKSECQNCQDEEQRSQRVDSWFRALGFCQFCLLRVLVTCLFVSFRVHSWIVFSEAKAKRSTKPHEPSRTTSRQQVATPDSSFIAADQTIAPSFAFTISLTVRPSAFLPASAACAAFITFPMSFIDAAPVSAIAALTTCSISSAEAP